MTTMPQEINQYVDELYNCRSLIRGMYLNLTSKEVYEVTENLFNNISNLLKPKYPDTTINLSISNFSINIVFTDIKSVPEKKINEVVNTIDTILRNFVSKININQSITNYISNPANPIFDQFIVGNSINIIL